jgi:transposase-like protein
MNKKQTRLSESEKLSILVEYFSGGHSINSITKKYGLSCCTLSYWIKRYPIDSVLLSLPQQSIEEVMAKKKANESEDEIARLQARIKALENALAFSKLETQARDMLIDIAEKQEKIQIRKKSGVK